MNIKSIKIRNEVFSADEPKICVPLTGTSPDALLQQAARTRAVADVAEWRADYFASGDLPAILPQVLAQLRAALGDMPLLFTYRSKPEGGNGTAPDEAYAAICAAAVASGGVDLLDMEYSRGAALCGALAGAAHSAGVHTVISRHDFCGTPPEDALMEQFAAMRAAGADFPKLACMANTPQDVLALLAASARHADAHGPVIAVPMGAIGRFGRVAGGLYGSCLTFAALDGDASAPGQLPAEQTRALVELFSCRE